MNDFVDLFADWERQWRPFSKQYQRVTVACSGGVDSVVLLHLLYEFTKQKKIFDLDVIHLNFNLRGEESLRDQRFVEALSAKYGLSTKVIQCDPVEKGSQKINNTQAWARKKREEAFKLLAKEGSVTALAHHQDDWVETIFMRLMRGSSAGELLGMEPVQKYKWRPLLNLSKNDLLTTAQNLQLFHCEDSSNAKINYRRNFVRHEILPQVALAFPHFRSAMIRFAKKSKSLNEIVKDMLEKKLLEAGGSLKTGEIPVKFFAALPSNEKQQILAMVISNMRRQNAGAGLRGQLSDRYLSSLTKSLSKAVTDHNCGTFDVPTNFCLKLSREKISFVQGSAGDEINRKKTAKKRRSSNVFHSALVDVLDKNNRLSSNLSASVDVSTDRPE